MPWVIYDCKDNTYLCQEAHGSGADDDLSNGLWQENVQSATTFVTATAAAKSFAKIDVEDWLPHIVPIWVELGPPERPRRPWNALTMDEKIKQLEADLEDTLAARVQRQCLK